MHRSVLNLTLILFTALTGAAVWRHGYWGILQPHFQSLAGAQVLVDLVIALCMVMIVLWKDARATGRPFWPWLVCTLVLGSFGPLLYLWTRRQPSL
jgi:hypothetical protein